MSSIPSPSQESNEPHGGHDFEPPSLSIAQSIVLHLGPGVAVVLLYRLLEPLTEARGYPPLMALLGAMLLGAVGLQLFHLLALGFVRNRRISLKGVLAFEQAANWRTYFLVPVGLVLFAFLLLAATSPVDAWLAERLRAILPSSWFFGDMAQLRRYAPHAVKLTFMARIFIDGVLIPIVEEMYFRGFLLPRMQKWGNWTPVFHHGLFTLYHLWQPYNWPTIFLATFPMVWCAWKNKNWRIAWITHMFLNLIGGFLSWALVVRELGG